MTDNVTDDSIAPDNEYKQNFDQVTPEEMSYEMFSDSFLSELDEVHRRSLFGIQFPPISRVVSWVEENINPQLQVSDQTPVEYNGMLAIRKVNFWKITFYSSNNTQKELMKNL